MQRSIRILVTAGPTREAIDPVRFISNASTGKMGYAIAGRALARGHEVRLVSGPVSIGPPAGISPIRVVTAAEMLDAVMANLAWCEALVMTAAVCDWRPKRSAPHKLKKSEMPGTLMLERTADILMAVAPMKGTRTYVGFAAETRDIESEARRKLAGKGLDMIVANEVGGPDSGFGADTNRAMLVTGAGIEVLPLMEKTALAERIVTWLEKDRSVL